MELYPKKFTMPEMYSIDAAIYVVQDLIHDLLNPALESLLVTLVETHTSALRTLAGIFKKSTPRAIPPRVVPPESQQ